MPSASGALPLVVASMIPLTAGVAAAQPAPPTTASPESAPTADDPKERARALYEQGVRYYDVAEYDKAISAFKESYVLSAMPTLLFNIAQAYRLKGKAHCGDAKKFYESYLRQRPDARDRAEIEAKVSEMKTCEEQGARAAAPPPPAAALPRSGPPMPAARFEPPPRVDASSAPAWGPIVVGGVGVATGIVGLVLYASVGGDYARLETECAGGYCAPDTWESYRTRERAGVAVAIAGAAITAGALVWWLSTPTPSRARAWLMPRWAGVSAGGTY